MLILLGSLDWLVLQLLTCHSSKGAAVFFKDVDVDGSAMLADFLAERDKSC